VIYKHFNHISVLVLTNLKMATWLAETCFWPNFMVTPCIIKCWMSVTTMQLNYIHKTKLHMLVIKIFYFPSTKCMFWTLQCSCSSILYTPDCCVKWSTKHLTVITWELQAGYALHMCLLKTTQTLPRLNAPYFHLPILWSGRKHLWVSAECHAQHSLLHHHEVVLHKSELQS